MRWILERVDENWTLNQLERRIRYWRDKTGKDVFFDGDSFSICMDVNMKCKICGYEPKGHVIDVLEKLLRHIRERHSDLRNAYISDLEMIEKSKEKEGLWD